MEIKIYYQDTDCGGVVYYANYLVYFERARTEYLLKKGVDIRRLADEGIFFLVRRAEIEYKSPARYGETLVVKTEPREISRASIDLKYTVTEKSKKYLIVAGSTLLACVGRDMKPRRLPDGILKLKAD
ncbi:MAG: acyl-CoA thioesterase [Elusimicrobia bacterium CG08_land_8_20_14_0_20_44_26]|nr:MAG: acyl-CoA thioesterase [Elusimicrobia bacterium CG08_land_8_20_14_0_20_44_26]